MAEIDDLKVSLDKLYKTVAEGNAIMQKAVREISNLNIAGNVSQSIDELTVAMKGASGETDSFFSKSKGAFSTFSAVLDTVDSGINVIKELGTCFKGTTETVETASKAVGTMGKAAEMTSSGIALVSDSIQISGGAWKDAISAASQAASATTDVTNAVAGTSESLTLVTAAQQIWQGALSALGGPVGMAAFAVGALGIAILAVAANGDEYTQALERIDTAHEKIAGAFETIGEAASSFYASIGQAGNIFDDFNDSIIVSAEKQAELAEAMKTTQSEITDITRTAAEERRGYTEDEVARLDELFEAMRANAQQQLEIQSTYQEVARDRAEDLAASHDMEIEEYEEHAKKILNSAQESKDGLIEMAENQMNETLALARERCTEEGVLNEEAYKAEREQAQEDYQAAVSEAEQKYGETAAIIEEGYLERSEATQKYIADSKTYNKELDDEETRHNDEMERLKEKYQTNDKVLNTMLEKEKKEHKKKLADINEDMANNMDDTATKQVGTWMAMVADTSMYGGDLSKESEKAVNTVIDTFDRMPEETKDTMKDAMDPMLKEMEKKEPGLFSKASSIADGILSRLRKSFDIHSPSRKMKEIFGNVMAGAEVGLSDNEDELLNKSEDIAESVLDRFNNLEFGRIAAKMKLAIELECSKLSASLTAKVQSSNREFGGTATAAAGAVSRNITIETPVYLDGREIARGTAEYMDSGLGRTAGRRERGN